MKKLIALMISLLLLLLFVSQSAFASNSPKLMIYLGSNIEGAVGDTVTVPIKFYCTEKVAIANLDFRLAYDNEKLELLNISAGEIVPNPSVSFNYRNLVGNIVFTFTDKSSDEASMENNGVFANLSFKIKKEGTSRLTLYKEGAINDYDLNPISCKFIEGDFEIPASSDSTIAPTKMKADKSALTDLSVTINSNGNNLVGIKNGTGTLIKDTDYNVSESAVVIKKGYLNYYFSKFPEQNLNLTFEFSKGRCAKLCIYTGNSSLPFIYPLKESFGIGLEEDVAVKTELNGNYISFIDIEGACLIPKIDYTYSVPDKKLIVRKSFLSYYFSKNNDSAKLNINFTGGSRILLEIEPVVCVPNNDIVPCSINIEVGKAADVVVQKVPDRTKLNDITYNSRPLVCGTEYTISGNDITLKAPFLNTLPEGTSTLVFGFKQGKSSTIYITASKPRIIKTVSVILENANVDSDNSVTMQASLKDVTRPIENIYFNLSYNESAVDSISVTPGPIATYPAVNFSYSISKGKLLIIFTNETQSRFEITKDGVLANIKIKLNPGYSDAEIGFLNEWGCDDIDLMGMPLNLVNDIHHKL